MVEIDFCKLISLVRPMEGHIPAMALCAECIKFACRMLSVRGASEQPWNNAAAARLGCLKERMGKRLLEFVVLHAACNGGRMARVDAFALMRVG